LLFYSFSRPEHTTEDRPAETKKPLGRYARFFFDFRIASPVQNTPSGFDGEEIRTMTETAKSVFATDGHPCFKYKLSDPKAFWNGAGGGVGVAGNHQVLQATASTERFWEEEPEEEIKRKVQDAKIKFHRDRQLQVKHLPRNVSEDVSSAFCCFKSYTRFSATDSRLPERNRFNDLRHRK